MLDVLGPVQAVSKATLFVALMSSTLHFQSSRAHSRRYCIVCSSPHVQLGLSLYPQLCIKATARPYPVRSLFRLFQCVHCSLCPAGMVSDGSIPIFISFALCSELCCADLAIG